jgi:hypothetical protein
MIVRGAFNWHRMRLQDCIMTTLIIIILQTAIGLSALAAAHVYFVRTGQCTLTPDMPY